MKTTYELRKFSNSNSPGLIQALRLYAENIEPSYRTDTNELLYWIDNFKKRFNDAFYIVGLYMNGTLIGYAQMAYFVEEKFVEVDYLVIDKAYRKNNSFYEFVDKIAEFIAEEQIVYDYIICEVGCYFEDAGPAESAKTLMRLLKMSHFGVIKCPYYVPRLGRRNYESQMRAVLMIYATEELKQLQKETYLMITHTLLFKYYQRWYADFFTDDENAEYKRNLDFLNDKIEKEVEARKVIEINGYQNLLPLNPTDFSEIKAKKGIRVITFLTIFIISCIAFAFVVLSIQKKFKMDISNQATIMGIAIIIASIVTSLLFNKRSSILTKLVEKLIDKI